MRINVFCTPEELIQWLSLLVMQYELEALWFSYDDEY